MPIMVADIIAAASGYNPRVNTAASSFAVPNIPANALVAGIAAANTTILMVGSSSQWLGIITPKVDSLLAPSNKV